MTDKIEIKEHQLVETQTITKVAVQVIQLVLNQGCKLSYLLYSDDGKLVKNGIMDLYGDDYAAWGSNDQFIIDYVLGKLGLIQKTI